MRRMRLVSVREDDRASLGCARSNMGPAQTSATPRYFLRAALERNRPKVKEFRYFRPVRSEPSRTSSSIGKKIRVMSINPCA